MSATARASLARIQATIDRYDAWYDRFPYQRPKLVRTGKSPTKRPSSLLTGPHRERSMWPDDMTYKRIKNRKSY